MASLDNNPHYWLVAHGIRDPDFVWAVAHGWLDDIDPLEPEEDHGRQLQLPLCGEMLPEHPFPAQPPRLRRLYRSRPPNRRDVLMGGATSSILPSRPRLRQEWVLR